MTANSKPFMMAIDRNGNMEHMSGVMLDLLGCLLEQKPCVVTIFDSGRKEPKYFCNVSYQPVEIKQTDQHPTSAMKIAGG